MALASRKLSKKLLKDRSGTGEISADRITRASSSFADDTFTEDPNVVDSLGPILYHTDLMSEDIDELRRHITEDRTITDNNFTTAEKSKLAGIEAGADVTDTTNVVNALTAGTNITIAANGTISSTASGGSGGGLTETPLAMISGRWQWSSADDGERIWTGNTAYGLFNYYSFSQEPSNSTLRNYSSAHRIDSTTANSDDAYEMPAYGIWCPNNGKKVKAKLSFRIQSAPASSTWGISLWSAPDSTSGTLNTGTDPTITLRASSRDITVTGNNYTYWTETCTTTSNMNDVWILPMLENRSGALTTNTYIYGQIALFLV
jgi:hypothetical protein